jgi:hypothetical protein
VKRLIIPVIALAAALAPMPAAAQGASGFSVVNQTGLNMTGFTIRRYGTQSWKDLGAAPSPGARGTVDFKDPDCAFDIQATLQGVGTVVWSGVNLCEVKAVILNRNASGAIWVDYE